MGAIISEVFDKEPSKNGVKIWILGIGTGQYINSDDQPVNGPVFVVRFIRTNSVDCGAVNGAQLLSLDRTDYGVLKNFNFNLTRGKIFQLRIREKDYHCVVTEAAASTPPLILPGKQIPSGQQKVEKEGQRLPTTAAPAPRSDGAVDYNRQMLELWQIQKGIDLTNPVNP